MFSSIWSAIRSRQLIRRLIVNTGWFTLEKLVRGTLSFAVYAGMARSLGAEQFGKLMFATSVSMMFAEIANLGADSLTVRNLVARPQDANCILGTTFWITLMTGLLSTLACSGVLVCLRGWEQQDWILGMLISSSFVFCSLYVIDFWYQARILVQYSVGAKLAGFLLATGLRVVGMVTAQPVAYYAAIFSLEILFSGVFLMGVYLYQGENPLHWRWSGSYAREFVRTGIPLLFAGTFVMWAMQIDKLVVGHLLGDAHLGIYAAMIRLSETCLFFSLSVGLSLSPVLTSLYCTDVALYTEKLQRVFRLMTRMGIVLGIVFLFGSDFFISFLYGQQFAENVVPLVIYGWTNLFIFHVSIRGRAWIVENKQNFTALYSFLLVCVNAALCLLLVPMYQENGAAIAAVVSWACAALIFPLLFPATRSLPKRFLTSFYLSEIVHGPKNSLQ